MLDGSPSTEIPPDPPEKSSWRHALLLRWRDHGDTRARAQLASELMPLLLPLAQLSLGKELRDRIDPVGVIDRVLMEGFEAIADFPPDGRMTLVQWFGRRLSWRIRDAVRALQSAPRGATIGSLTPTLQATLDGDARLGRRASTPSSCTRRREAVEILHDAISRLRSEDQELIHKRWLLGLSYDEIAAEDGRRREALYQACHRAIERLERELRSLGLVADGEEA